MKSNRRSAWQERGGASRSLAALIFLTMLRTGMVWAQSAGTFTAIGNMTTPWALHSATLLLNGKVLITGGRARRARRRALRSRHRDLHRCGQI